MTFSLTLEDKGGPGGSIRRFEYDQDALINENRARRIVAYLKTRHKIRTHCERSYLFWNKLIEFTDPFERYMADVTATRETVERMDHPNNIFVDTSFPGTRKLQRYDTKGVPCECFKIPAWPKHVDDDLYQTYKIMGTGMMRGPVPVADPRLAHLGAKDTKFDPDTHDLMTNHPDLFSDKRREWIKRKVNKKMELKKKPFDLGTYRNNVLELLRHIGPTEARKWFQERSFQLTEDQAKEWYSSHFN